MGGMGKPTSNEKPIITGNLALEYEICMEIPMFSSDWKNPPILVKGGLLPISMGESLIGQKLFPHDTYYRNLQGHKKKREKQNYIGQLGWLFPIYGKS